MMAVLEDTTYNKALNHYKNHYLNKKYEDLDESTTRILINHLLSDVLGYKEIEDIKVEYPIKGGIVDYLVKLKDKKLIVIEAKSIKTKLTYKHLRQAIYYATIIGSDWIILTNARYVELYKVKFNRPIKVNLIFSVDLKNLDKNSNHKMYYISKKSLLNGDLDRYSKIYETLDKF